MPTFTMIIHDKPMLGVEAYDMHSAVRSVQNNLLRDQPKANTVSVVYSLVERGGEQAGTFHLATVMLRNVRRRVLDTALVWGEQPMEAKKQYHANDHNRCITCHECGNNEFYNVDRSLDYENHVCSECGATAHTLTETGASA